MRRPAALEPSIPKPQTKRETGGGNPLQPKSFVAPAAFFVFLSSTALLRFCASHIALGLFFLSLPGGQGRRNDDSAFEQDADVAQGGFERRAIDAGSDDEVFGLVAATAGNAAVWIGSGRIDIVQQDAKDGCLVCRGDELSYACDKSDNRPHWNDTGCGLERD
jgi:hypothetical protein